MPGTASARDIQDAATMYFSSSFPVFSTSRASRRSVHYQNSLRKSCSWRLATDPCLSNRISTRYAGRCTWVRIARVSRRVCRRALALPSQHRPARQREHDPRGRQPAREQLATTRSGSRRGHRPLFGHFIGTRRRHWLRLFHDVNRSTEDYDSPYRIGPTVGLETVADSDLGSLKDATHGSPKAIIAPSLDEVRANAGSVGEDRRRFAAAATWRDRGVKKSDTSHRWAGNGA